MISAAIVTAVAMTVAPANAAHPHVAVNCVRTHGRTTSAVVVNTRHAYSTGWMHGWKITARTRTGQVYVRDGATLPFNIRPARIRTFTVTFPRQVRSCSASVMWGR